MTVYRLDPINPKDACWSALSTHVETLWTNAPTLGKARELVAAATFQMHASIPRGPKPKSPWLDDAQSLCVIDRSGLVVQDGEVVTMRGERLT